MIRDLTVPEKTDFRLLRLVASVLTMFGFAILALMVFRLFVPWSGLNGWPLGMAQGIVLSAAMLFYALALVAAGQLLFLAVAAWRALRDAADAASGRSEGIPRRTA